MRIILSGVAIYPPTYVNLYKYIKKLPSIKNRFGFLAYNEEKECVGYLYCDIDDNKLTIESSYGVYFLHNRKGYGTKIIEFSHQFGKLLGMKDHIVYVSEQNVSSNRVFEKKGFLKCNEYLTRNLPLLGGDHRFYKFYKRIK